MIKAKSRRIRLHAVPLDDLSEFACAKAVRLKNRKAVDDFIYAHLLHG